jgi:hypothetical protein
MLGLILGWEHRSAIPKFAWALLRNDGRWRRKISGAGAVVSGISGYVGGKKRRASTFGDLQNAISTCK